MRRFYWIVLAASAVALVATVGLGLRTGGATAPGPAALWSVVGSLAAALVASAAVLALLFDRS